MSWAQDHCPYVSEYTTLRMIRIKIFIGSFSTLCQKHSKLLTHGYTHDISITIEYAKKRTDGGTLYFVVLTPLPKIPNSIQQCSHIFQTANIGGKQM